MLLPLLIAAIVGYLVGSVPFGYLVARSRGVNIFEVGSKNPGATNVRRVLGAGPGNLVFTLDALKGFLAASWSLLAYTQASVAYDLETEGIAADGIIRGTDWNIVAIGGLVGALLGHSFSCFTKFRGGKGVATSVGGLLILMPVALAIGAVVWGVSFYAPRYVSLASLLAAVSLPIVSVVMHQPKPLLILAILVAVFVILRHRSNIVRLLNGTENKFSRQPVPPPHA